MPCISSTGEYGQLPSFSPHSPESQSWPFRKWPLLIPTHNPRTKRTGFWSGCSNERSLTIRDEEMTERCHIQVRQEQANRYASREDFHTIFSERLNEPYQLLFLLTRDPAMAERSLVSGLEHCASGNRAFRAWVCSWAKHTHRRECNSRIKTATYPFQFTSV